MSQAKYKRKWRKIQAGEKEILEYNVLKDSFDQESSEDVRDVFDKHFDNYEEHSEQNLSAMETVSSDEETGLSIDFNEDHILINEICSQVWYANLNVLVIVLINFQVFYESMVILIFQKTIVLCLVPDGQFLQKLSQEGNVFI